ncbi:hypothetical protein AKJ09_00562 [Labilithrix luteola]|uniref:HTH cro/C1-type domain-containing protein n=2 Tax=Labilithrix luteola TaxID=1391654 RepID=A0A0K1PK29_9BACT|nr:hypothetical protein AKJ09_00562 [Labilithrix luteola]
MSQLSLSLEAGVSSRHLSFIENGRSAPSREMVLALAETLDIPLRDRNELLQAAGYASVYRETPLEAPSMDHVRESLRNLLRASEPNPTLVVDRRYDVRMANDAAKKLLACFCKDVEAASRQPNLVRLLVARDGMRDAITNRDEVMTYMVDRIRRELTNLRERNAADDAILHELEALEPRGRQRTVTAPSSFVLPVKLRKGDVRLELFTTITTLGTPLDITLQELRIETLYPANAESRATMERLLASN